MGLSNAVYAGDKMTGVVEDGVFKRRVRSSAHFLRKPPAIAHDETVLAQAKCLGAVSVHIDDMDTGAQYDATIHDIEQYGFAIERGAGTQIALPLYFWTKTEPNNQ